MLKNANHLMRNKNYVEAIRIYEDILRANDVSVLKNTIANNIEYCKRKLSIDNQADRHFDLKSVDCAQRAFEDTVNGFNNRTLRNGITALIRVKDGERFVENSILSIYDLVDEIVVIENNSKDDTFNILNNLQKNYDKIRVYRYEVNVPAVGVEHKKAVDEDSLNTLATFYNWGLSKVETFFVLKWDADFVACKKNLAELINKYDLRNSNADISIWCTGSTSFNGKVIRTDSFYDEFRIFSQQKGIKWENYQGCETLANYIYKADRCLVFGCDVDVRNILEQDLVKVKKNSKPIFIEIKDSINLKPDGNIVDLRDKNDNAMIRNTINLTPDYNRINKINEYRVLVTVPSLSLGGGNYWAKLIYDQLDYIGIRVDIGVQDSSGEYNKNGFYEIPNKNIISLINPSLERLFSYTHVIYSNPVNLESFLNINCNVYVFTHSDVSYINNFALKSNHKTIALNDATIVKFAKNGKVCKLIYNYLPPSSITNQRNMLAGQIKILYCNRISFDKNVPMILLAFKKLIDFTQADIRLTLLAGGSEYSDIELQTIQSCINKLSLQNHVDLYNSQKDTEMFYLSHDFCILASVSEGCSYGLLEAINYEMPIVSTDIPANCEVHGKCLPVFELSGVNKRSQDTICIDNYLDYLSDIGYINLDDISKHLHDLSNFLELYREFNNINRNPNVLVTYLCPDIPRSYFNNHTEFYKYFETQNNKFNMCAENLMYAMNNTIVNFVSYKKNVVKLKRDLLGRYYSLENNRIQLYSALFSDDFMFV